MKYLCQSRDCFNEIHPCVHGHVCDLCKVKLLKTTHNNINRNLPIEICDIIYSYVDNKKKIRKCIECKKHICTFCSKYFMPWCCGCYAINVFMY